MGCSAIKSARDSICLIRKKKNDVNLQQDDSIASEEDLYVTIPVLEITRNSLYMKRFEQNIQRFNFKAQ